MPRIASERFPKTARLRKRPEFLKLSRTGSKFQSANFVVISQAHDGAESRIGITVSGKVGRPEEIASAIYFLADNEQSSFMTGQALVVDGGATARLSTE